MASSATLDLILQLEDRASKGLASISKTVGSLGKFAAGAALGGGIAGVTALTGVLAKSVSAARESNIVMGQTDAVLKSTGMAAGVTAQQVSDLAGSLSAASGKSLFGDEQIQSAENMTLTFTAIGKEVFPQVTQTAVDMAQALHTTPEAMAQMTGKALSSVQGITALRKIGVQFTDDQVKMAKQMMATGDTIGYQKLVLGELAKEFGGSAAAAAAADGGFAQFSDQLGEMAEGIGKQLMPAVTTLMGFLTGPDVQAGLQSLADGLVTGVQTAIGWLTTTAIPAIKGFVGNVKDIWGDIVDGFNEAGIEGAIGNFLGRLGDMVPAIQPVTDWLQSVLPGAISIATTAWNLARDSVITFIQALQGDWTNSDQILFLHQVFGELGLIISQVVVPAIQTFFGWLQDNWAIVSQVAAGIAIAVVAFETISTVVGVATAVFGGLAAVLGVILSPIGLIALAVGALYVAWQTNFLGIQTTLTDWWNTTGQPIFSQLVAWLQTNIPVAIQALVGFWNGTLLPALQTAGTWIQANVIPALVTLGTWLGTNIPVAVQTLVGFWNGTLLPALQTVGTFITGTLIPTLTTLVSGGITVVQTAVQTMATFWTGTLQPALQTVYNFISTSIVPLLEALGNVQIAALNLATTALAGVWQNVLLPAITDVANWLSQHLQPAVQAVGDFFTNTFNPAVTTAGNTVSTTLSPAVSAAAGFFNTLGAAIGGVSGAISTVTGWLNTLAGKLNTIHLPDWMTPGSPTPWEIGMYGVADSTKAATAETAKLGRTLNGLSIKGGKGGEDDSGPAKAIADTISSVADAISKGVDAFAKLGTFARPDTTVIQSFASAVSDVTQIFINTAANFKAKAVDAAGVFADGAGKVLGIIGNGVAALTSLQTYNADALFKDAVYGFASDVKQVVNAFWTVADSMQAEGVVAAGAFAENAAKVLGIIGNGVQAIAALRDYDADGLYEDAVIGFASDVKRIVNAFWVVADSMLSDGVQAAATFAEGAGKVLGIISTGVKAIADLQTYNSDALFEDAVIGFAADVKRIVNAFWTVADSMMTEGVAAAAAFADGAGKVISIIGPGVEGLVKLRELKSVPAAAMDVLVEGIKLAVQKMGDAAKLFTDDFLAPAVAFADAAGKVIAPISTAIDTFGKLKDYKGVLPAMVELIVNDIKGTVGYFSAAVTGMMTDGVAAAATFAQTAGQITGFIGSAVDTLSKVAGYKGIDPKTLQQFFADLTAVMTQAAQIASTGFSDVWSQSFEMLLPDMTTALTLALQALQQQSIQPWLEGINIPMRDEGAHWMNNVADGARGAAGAVSSALQKLGSDGAAALQTGWGHPTLTFTVSSSGTTDKGLPGNPLASLVGGKRASGGPVAAGVPYLVGENRPEVFVPNVAGRIVSSVDRYMADLPAPRRDSGGNVTSVTNHVYITASDTNTIIAELQAMGIR
jgi:hypothetical protein